MLNWKQQTRQYESGKNGFVGKYIFFQIVWDGLTSKDDPKKYKLKCFLPGINIDLENFEYENNAMRKAERVLKLWLTNTSLFFM